MSLFCWTQRKIFWRMWETEQFWGTIDFHSIYYSYYGSQWCPKTAWLQTFFKYLPLCSAEQRHSYRFGTTWGWVNDDTIFIFGWTIPLSRLLCVHKGVTRFLLSLKWQIVPAYFEVKMRARTQNAYRLAGLEQAHTMRVWTDQAKL